MRLAAEPVLGLMDQRVERAAESVRVLLEVVAPAIVRGAHPHVPAERRGEVARAVETDPVQDLGDGEVGLAEQLRGSRIRSEIRYRYGGMPTIDVNCLVK